MAISNQSESGLYPKTVREYLAGSGSRVLHEVAPGINTHPPQCVKHDALPIGSGDTLLRDSARQRGPDWRLCRAVQTDVPPAVREIEQDRIRCGHVKLFLRQRHVKAAENRGNHECCFTAVDERARIAQPVDFGSIFASKVLPVIGTVFSGSACPFSLNLKFIIDLHICRHSRSLKALKTLCFVNVLCHAAHRHRSGVD